MKMREKFNLRLRIEIKTGKIRADNIITGKHFKLPI